MSDEHDCDLLVIGGGSAGTTAAMAAVGFRKKVILIEKGLLGGTCTNVGCVPSKTWLRAADLIRSVGQARTYGLIDKAATPSFGLIQEAKTGITDTFRAYGTRVLEKNDVEIVKGEAAFAGPLSVSVDGRTINAARVLIASGAEPFVPPIEGLTEIPYLTSTTALASENLPKSILIIGGAYIGLEMATFFNAMGVETTVIEALDRIAPNEDADISEFLAGSLRDQGIAVHAATKVLRVGRQGAAIAVEAEQAGEKITFAGQEILIATGRIPALAPLHLEAAGVAYGRKGIDVNEFLETSVAGVWAAGDVVPSLQLEHVGVYEGWLAGQNMFSANKVAADYRVIPRVMFTYPEVASVGDTEEQAAGKTRVAAAALPYSALAMAKIGGEPQGLIKLVADLSSRQLVGAHIVGQDAGNLIHLAALAMQTRTPVDQIAKTVSAYPTLAQGFFYAAEALAAKLKH